MKSFLLLILPILIGSTAFGQNSQPMVGREAAARYFQKRGPAAQVFSGGSSAHYLALHFGRYMGTQSYEWGKNGQEDDVGGNTFGVTYRIGEWQNSMDLNLRIDYAEYSLSGEKSSKISFMPLLTFPDAGSRFPLYFGVGLGMGVFFKQVEKKSPLSLDYQLILGARFFDVFENTGFFIEAIEYTVKHDDGKTFAELDKADIVLVGISRTSKTPLSIFLSHKGWKVANVPMVLDTPLPEELFKIDQRRIVGLIIDMDSLQRIRKSRLEKFGQDPGGEYASMSHIAKEIEYAERIFKQNRRWPVFNVTERALEENASEIVRIIAARLGLPDSVIF